MDWPNIERRVRTSSAISTWSSGATGGRKPLSGGNQQRFVLGRELHDEPPLLVSRKSYAGSRRLAAAAIHARIRNAAAKGTAVIFYSSDLDELAEVSHRVLVVRASGVAFSEPEKESIGHLLLDSNG